jgi:alkanesulfonate monooxygenase SsuD/methylene tetrahydromethanopterin reductase-like flavin-dependent oxidoreductase (luciferase family)
MSGLGMVIGSSVGPERLTAAAHDAEAAGFGELWLAEDLTFTGGMSGANIALGATHDIQVGLGVVSAVLRHPALLAMEIATTARAHPRRVVLGIGLGVPAWIRQIGLLPVSPLSAVRECLTAVRGLLDGGEVTQHEGVFHLDKVKLVYPEPVPLHLGVIGPRMLQLSGEIADGSILSVAAGAKYVRWAREHIEVGRERAGRSDEHRLTVFAIYAVDDDAERARRAARRTLGFYKASGGRNALTDVEGISDELEAMIARGGVDGVVEGMPDRWVDELTVSGAPAEVAAKIDRLRRAGADAVALFPAAGEDVGETIARTASEVMPLL